MNKQESDTRGWYLIYTKPRAEKLAQENLQRQKFTTYLPLIQKTQRRRGKYVALIEPMFPRYLFIHLNCTTDNWAPIRSTLGVSSIVRFATYPMQVPDSLLVTLQKNENENGIQLISQKEFQFGDCIRIIDGAMTGVEGVFESKTSKERVIVLLNIAGQYTRVNMTRHDLQLA
jgi:transcriptional antiterminator RfaH